MILRRFKKKYLVSVWDWVRCHSTLKTALWTCHRRVSAFFCVWWQVTRELGYYIFLDYERGSLFFQLRIRADGILMAKPDWVKPYVPIKAQMVFWWLVLLNWASGCVPVTLRTLSSPFLSCKCWCCPRWRPWPSSPWTLRQVRQGPARGSGVSFKSSNYGHVSISFYNTI